MNSLKGAIMMTKLEKVKLTYSDGIEMNSWVLICWYASSWSRALAH